MPEQVRLTELLAALSTAADLTMGQPVEQSLRAALLAVRLAEEADVDPATADAAYLVALLRWSGCTGNAAAFARMLGDDIGARADLVLADPSRPGDIARVWSRHALPGTPGPESVVPGLVAEHCEVAQQVAVTLGLPAAVVAGLGQVFERWDGHGLPAGVGGVELEPAGSLAVLAGDLEILARVVGDATAVEAVRARAGASYPPGLVDRLPAALSRSRSELAAGPAWAVALAAAPRPRPPLGTADLDRALAVLGDFVDLKVPALAGHSRTTAALGEVAGRALGLAGGEVRLVRLAGAVHDLGRVAISNAVWEAPRPLTAAEWDAVHLHPYYSQRCLARVPGLAEVARVGSLHHERLDGRGYFRQLPAAALPAPARALAAADALAGMRAARPHRPALSPPAAADALHADVRAGRLDRQAVDGLLAGAVPASASAARPAGLTDREVEVVRLLARGATNRQAAEKLAISPKTVGRHVENAYAKLGVHTRAAATYAALGLGLLDLTTSDQS